MRGVKIELTPQAEAWIIRHFKHTRNAEIAERGGYDCGYDQDTRRSERLEPRPFRFYEITTAAP